MNINYFRKLKTSNYLLSLNARLSKKSIGNKAASLQFLNNNGCEIPLSFVIQGKAFDEYLIKKQEVVDRIKKELDKLPNHSFAIRSSTNIEDSDDFSHAGQFGTFLNVHGTGEILDAVIKVWQSAMPKNDDKYFEKTGGKKSVSCAVIIQKMVDSKLAGVSFSKNPVNNLQETIIEANEGTG